MSTSFVGIGGKGFWMRDGVLQLWLRLLALHVENTRDPNSPSHAIRTNWLVASQGGFAGCIPDGMEQAVSTADGRSVVLNAIESLRKALLKAPPTLDRGVLNVLGFDPLSARWIRDFETRRLLEVTDAFTDLIHGRVDSDASDTAFMPGCR
jgi:hypothetical protein